MWSHRKKPSQPAASLAAARRASTRASESSPNGATKIARRAGTSAEDREATAARERGHAVLDRGLDLVVLAVHVALVVRPLGVVVELDRLEQRGADLRRQRQLGQHRGRD